MAEHRNDGPAERAPTAPRRRSPLLIAGRAAACSVALAVFAASGVVWYEYTSLTDGMVTSKVIAETKKDAPKHLDNSVNLLLIGLDSRRNMDGTDIDPALIQDELHAGHSSDVGGYNTNSLILLHIPAGGGKVQAVSIPRDDYVMTYNGDGSQMGMAKIKEAYGAAKEKATPALQAKGLKGADLEKAGRDIGRAATIRTVQKFLDQPVDHIAEVNLIGFYDIAKAVEPIEVCLTHDTKDPAKDGQGSGADFHKGVNKLNAAQALSFVRQRHNLDDGNGNADDFARTHRQQAFISAVMHNLKQKGVIGDLGEMQKLFGVVQKDLVIDNEWNILDFAQQAPNLTGGNVEFNTLTFDRFDRRNGQDVNLVTPAKIQKVVKQLFGYADTAPAPAPTDPATGTPAQPSQTPTPTATPTTTRTPTATRTSPPSGKRTATPTSSTPAPTGSTPPPTDPAADLPMQGPKVEAEADGGIPCVF
ncbi:LCP family protein [Kitasatospora sp. NPDC097643]|uniref:LCP family protein n=1 Tax=Kitasatospora sp. NPDC097643 TaxID=3157230 RepID=UPI003323F693